VPQLLRSADMLSICSAHEGFPNVLLEAMAARLPTVTTAVGDAARIIEDDFSGYVVPSGDIEALTNRIVHLAGSMARRRRLGDAARREVEQRFSLKHLGVRLLATYGAIAEQQRRPHILPIVARQSQPVARMAGGAQ